MGRGRGGGGCFFGGSHGRGFGGASFNRGGGGGWNYKGKAKGKNKYYGSRGGGKPGKLRQDSFGKTGKKAAPIPSLFDLYVASFPGLGPPPPATEFTEEFNARDGGGRSSGSTDRDGDVAMTPAAGASSSSSLLPNPLVPIDAPTLVPHPVSVPSTSLGHESEPSSLDEQPAQQSPSDAASTWVGMLPLSNIRRRWSQW
jgi:hypothetical protein